MTPRCEIHHRCEIHQPSFRHHLIRHFATDDACLRYFLRRQTLYLYYPSILMVGDLAQKVHDAFLDSFFQPVYNSRNLLREPPSELLRELSRGLLCRVDYIEYVGKITHDPETDHPVRGAETHSYHVNLKTIYDRFRAERKRYDTAKAILCLRGEQVGISEELLMDKYHAAHVLPLSYARARAALQELDRLKYTENNGNRRKWGRDLLKTDIPPKDKKYFAPYL